jgi:hypothetical protein
MEDLSSPEFSPSTSLASAAAPVAAVEPPLGPSPSLAPPAPGPPEPAAAFDETGVDEAMEMSQNSSPNTTTGLDSQVMDSESNTNNTGGKRRTRKSNRKTKRANKKNRKSRTRR